MYDKIKNLDLAKIISESTQAAGLMADVQELHGKEKHVYVGKIVVNVMMENLGGKWVS